MLKILTTEQMRRCDRRAIDDLGIPDLVLMENAGCQIVEVMEEAFESLPPRTVAVCCGKGNNGGDGFVVARHLHNLGRQVRVYLFADPGELAGSAAVNHGAVAAMGIPVVPVTDAETWMGHAEELAGFDCVVDALLGTGLQGPVRGLYREVVEAIDRCGAPVVAVDVPTGLSGDSGQVPGDCVEADLTVTMAALKRCHVLPPAEFHCGDVAVVDISIPPEVIDEVEDAVGMWTEEDCLLRLPPREPRSHKGTYGRILVVAGSVGTAGAAVLTAEAALRSGAGLVTVAVPEPVYGVVASQLTEALVRPLAAEGGGLAAGAAEEVLELAEGMDALAVGPGVGTGDGTVAAIRRIVAEAPVPAVVDADGLNAFAGRFELLRDVAGDRVLTPHPGEMARLLETEIARVQGDRLGVADDAAERSGATVLLKGFRTVMAGPGGNSLINPTGNPGMASGGTGDVLTGMVATFLGRSLTPRDAAALAAFLHGRAGDLAAERQGEESLIAGDLVDALPAAFASIRDRDDESES